MKKLVILLILWSFTSAIGGDPCLDGPESGTGIYTVDCEVTYATEDLTGNDWEFVTSTLAYDGEVTLQEIIKALEIAKRLIDPVNKVYAIESGAALLIYQWPAKPSVELRAKADKLEQDEKDYDFMIGILEKLQKIQGE